MIIKVNSLTDFKTMLTTCIHNGETSVRVFVSRKSAYVGTSIGGFKKAQIKFTYVLFTHLYQVVFSDNKPTKEYENMEKSFLDFQGQRADFRIIVFDDINVNYKENYIEVSKQLNVI